MKKRKIGILLIFILMICPSGIYSQEFKVSGEIKDEQTGRGLEGVNIVIKNKRDNKYAGASISGAEGNFTVENLPGGNYIIQTSYVGYKTQSTTVRIEKSDVEVSIDMEANIISIGEVEVSSLRHLKKLKETPVPLAIIDHYNIERIPAATPADIIQTLPGVSLARDGIWATSVNIRGLSEQRVILLVDGYRVETATDIAAAFAMFDMNDIEQIEVIKGAASSIYGTSGLGGMVNIITKDVGFNESFKYGGNVSSGYGSVNTLLTEHIDFNLSNKSWYGKISGTFRDAGDTETPEGILENSHFSDYNLALTLGYKIDERQTIKVNYQRFYGSDIGIPGGVAFPAKATATYPLEKRELLDVEYTVSDLTPSLKKLTVRSFSQLIERDVEIIPNNPSDTNFTTLRVTTPVVFTPSADHHIFGFQTQSDWQIGRHNVIAGIDAWQRSYEGNREKLIHIAILDTAFNQIRLNEVIRGEKPVPNSLFRSTGIFAQDDIDIIKDKLLLSLGARYELIYIHNDQVNDPDFMINNGTWVDSIPNQRITFEENEETNQSWAANVGLLYSIAKDLQVSLSLGNSFRSPVLEERFKYIDLGSSVRLGNPDLLPEHGYSADLGFKIWKPRLNVMLNGFVNKLTDLIIEVPGEFVYSLTNDPATADTFPALINTNMEEALLYGFDLDIQYNVYKSLVVYHTSAYVKGKNLSDDGNLPLIPPFNTRTGLRYSFKRLLNIDFSTVMAAKQDKVVSGEEETDGYTKFDLMFYTSTIHLNKVKLQFYAGVENLTDVAYTNHLATNRGSINYEPGRNVFAKVAVRW